MGFKNRKSFGDDIKKRIVGALFDSPELKETGDLFKKTIRTGKYLDGTPIKALESSTIKKRKELAKYNQTHPEYSDGKSNLTFTGQFIESFVATIKLVKDKIIITLTPSGIHKGYKGKKGKAGKGLSNQKLAEHLINGGRDYRTIGKEASVKIVDILKQILKRKTI